MADNFVVFGTDAAAAYFLFFARVIIMEYSPLDLLFSCLKGVVADGGGKCQH